MTILVPLLLLLALDRMDLAIYAAFAAFTGIYGRNEPHGVRLRTQLRAGLLMLGVLTAATVAGRFGISEAHAPWGLVLWTTVIAGAATVATGGGTCARPAPCSTSSPSPRSRPCPSSPRSWRGC